MWFRRRKKTDPDEALTETLRSLQTLLEDDHTNKQRKYSDPPHQPSERPQVIFNKTDRKPVPSLRKIPTANTLPGTTAHSVVSDEHLTWDLDADLSTEDPIKTPPGFRGEKTPDPLRDGGDVPALISPGGSPPADPEDATDASGPEPDSASIDSIPVLNNIVLVRSTEVSPHGATQADTTLLDNCIVDFNNRLVQHDLTPMDSPQEQYLRTFLMSLLSFNPKSRNG